MNSVTFKDVLRDTLDEVDDRLLREIQTNGIRTPYADTMMSIRSYLIKVLQESQIEEMVYERRNERGNS